MLVKEKTLEQLNDSNWKVRKEAMDELAALLAEASHRIGPKDGGILASLKVGVSIIHSRASISAFNTVVH